MIPHLRLPLDISCINTGAAAGGLTQGGGWGHSSRMFGLACDSLADAELVDAGGRFIIASEPPIPISSGPCGATGEANAAALGI